MLLNRGGGNQASRHGITPMHHACTADAVALVQLLIRHDARRRHPALRSQLPTAMYLACAVGSLECAGELARRGDGAHAVEDPLTSFWRPSLAGGSTGTATQIARDSGHVGLADWLDAVRGFTPLHWACLSASRASVRAALRRDAAGALRARSHTGTTAMALATGQPVGYEFTPPPTQPGVAKMLRRALRPWSPLRHHLQTATFRRTAFVVMCLAQRLRDAAPTTRARHSRRLAARRRRVSLALPNDLWLQVLGACGRHWWGA